MAEIASRRSPALTAHPWLRPLAPLRRWVLHGERAARDRASPVWGMGFSEVACRAVRQGPRATLWLGPEEHLLLDFSEATNVFAGLSAPSTVGAPLEGLEAAIESALAGTRHALVDVSHRQIALEVSGPHAETLLAGACPLDLEVRRFPVGMCTRTVLAKADVTLWRTEESRFHLEVWRSFSGYVTSLLEEIAREFYPAG